MTRSSIVFSLTIVASLFCGQSQADNGLHLGWCNGVGNPHKAANCGGGSGPTTGGTPSTVPTSNQLPGTGGSVTTTPGTVSTNVVVLQPNPPTVITGTGPVIPVQGQPGPTFTGTGQLPIVITPTTPTVLTGTGPVPTIQGQPNPSFTGGSLPTIVLIPNPPTVFTGTSPISNVQVQPTPSFVGGSLPTITVLPNPPTTFVGYGPVPSQILVQPNPLGSFTGTSAVPQITPGRVPMAIPYKNPKAVPYLVPSISSQRTPGQVPTAIPGGTPQATPVLIPRPRPTSLTKLTSTSGGKITHQPVTKKAALGPGHVTQTTGRQALHDAPVFAAEDGGQPWNCLASGHGQRKTLVGRQVLVNGALRHVGAVDVLGRDLPALHPAHANCIISVRRKSDR